MDDLAGAASSRLVWTVAGLVHAVGDALASRFPACTVRGELSAFSRAASGHCYFCLKDADGEAVLLRCAMFRRAAGLMDFSPADGQLVELRGRLTLYEPRGELQFVVESMRPAGTGALYEQFLRLKAKLQAQGLFDASGKKPLPPYPRRIGVVTSLGAAALHDVVSTFARRAPHLEIVVYPSVVQGTEAPQALVRALDLAARRQEVDMLILCRGGGSLEDLWAFNDERVVRAVADCPLPIICGVGHEIDITLCDFAADLRAPTPTAAAELAAPSQADCAWTLQALQARLVRRVRQLLDSHGQRMDAVSARVSRPTRALQRQSDALGMLRQRLCAAARHAPPLYAMRLERNDVRLRRAHAALLARQTQRLEALGARLQAMDPKRVLSRGYAWLADDAGRPVLSVAQLAVGRQLQAVLADGSASVEVTDVSPGPSSQ